MKTRGKLLSLFIAAVLLVCALPNSLFLAFASGEAECDTFAEFKAAMENPSIKTVSLNYFSEDITNPNGDKNAITTASASGEKILVLSDNSSSVMSQTVLNGGFENLIYVGSGIKLTVTGGGSLSWNPSVSGGSNALFFLDGGSLLFDNEFEGTICGTAEFEGMGGTLIQVNSGNLVIKSGSFNLYDEGVSYDRGIIQTVSPLNTYITLLGGHFSFMSTEKGGYVLLNNSTNVMIHSISYTTSSGAVKNLNEDCSLPLCDYNNFVGWQPFNKNEPGFPLVDLGEAAEIDFNVLYSNSYSNGMLNGCLSSVVVKEYNNGEWNVVKSYYSDSWGSKITTYLGTSDAPLVKNYKVVFYYSYSYNGEVTEFRIERDLRAEWKDLSYNEAGTKDNPVKVDTFEELRAALYDTKIEYVEVTEDINKELNYLSYESGTKSLKSYEEQYVQGLITPEELYQKLYPVDVTDGMINHSDYLGNRELNMCAITTRGNKHLILSNDVILSANSFPFNYDDTGFCHGIDLCGNLTISGSGALQVTLTSPNFGTEAAAIYSNTGYDLTVDGASIIAKSDQLMGYAHSIIVSNGGLVINGGEFKGENNDSEESYSHKADVSGVVWLQEGTNFAFINGGTFTETELGKPNSRQLSGLRIDKTALNKTVINGGTFVTGIIHYDGISIRPITETELYSALKEGASYVTQVGSVSGVGYTTYKVTPSPVNLPDGIGRTPDDPAYCSNFYELKAALEDMNIKYIVAGNITHTLRSEPNVGNDPIPAINVWGEKVLTLAGNITVSHPAGLCKFYGSLFGVPSGATLRIKGSGNITFRAAATLWANSVVSISSGSLIVEEGFKGTISGGYIDNSVIIAGYAVVVSDGDAEIKNGNFVGALSKKDSNRDFAAICLDGGETTISGGSFVSKENGETNNNDYGIYINDTARLYIKGGSFSGIKLPYGATLSEYLEGNGLKVTSNGFWFNPESEYSQEYCTGGKEVEVYKEISEISIYIDSVSADEEIEDEVYFLPEGSHVCSVKWYENGTAISSGSAFKVGETYKVEITLATEGNARFSTPLSSAKINGATVMQSGGDRLVVLTADFGECPAKINRVELEIDAPVQHAKPDQTATANSSAYKQAPAGVNMFDKPLQWQESTDGSSWEIMDLNDTFTVGYYYRVYIDVMPNSGYEFAIDAQIEPAVDATVNGYYAVVSRYPEEDPADLIGVCYNFGKLNDNVIEQIDIDGITEPVVDEKPSYNCSVSGNGYILDTNYDDAYDAINNAIGWWDVTDNKWVEPDETFQIGHQYKVVIYVKTESGYEFYTSGNDYAPEGWGYINDNYATFGRQTNARYQQTLSWTFTCQPKLMKSVGISGLDFPIDGETPDFEVISNSEYYTVTNIVWQDYENNLDEMTETDTFIGGNKYYLMIEIEAKERDGYKLCKFVSGNKTVATLNGVEVVKVAGDSWQEVVSSPKKVVIFYTFNKAAGADTKYLSGEIISSGSETDDILVELIPQGSSEAAYKTTVRGNRIGYLFYDIASGTYTLRVTKNGHAPYEETVVIGNESLIKNVTLISEGKQGDANGNGVVDTSDAIAILRYIAGYSDANFRLGLANYNGDSLVDTADAIAILRFVAGY